MTQSGIKWQTEFPDYPATEMVGFPAVGDFVDTSWCNDMCPSFTSDALGLTVWVDYPSAADREFPESKRFSVTPQDHGIEVSGDELATDVWSDVETYISLHAMTPTELNGWYEKTVGYRPQVDEPNMTDAELRDLCLSYWREHVWQVIANPVIGKTRGQLAYEADCAREPLYQDKTVRKTWEQLPSFCKENWEKNPTPRGTP